jgi:hypothetical protein
MFIGAALVALCAPATALAKPVSASAKADAAPAKDKESPAKKMPDFDLGQMMAVFDKIFPPQPEPPPARLALSRTAVQGLFPDGTYARMMGGMMHGVVDRVMGLSQADFGKQGEPGKPADTATLRQTLMKNDPNFEERMRIMERIVGEEMAKIAAVIEPRLRDGLAHSMARRFDEKQLTDINAFLATDSGRAFGSQSMAMWVDPDVMRAMLNSFPEIMTAMPGAMKRIETETARLPKPKTAKAKPTT